MAVVDARISVWEALAGRAPGQPVGPADPGLWRAVAERLNPTRARPVLRPGIESAELTSVRGVPYVMLRSPDGTAARYLRLAPEEWALARTMDGTRTVARLVAEFARLTGRLAPEQVTRVVADLAANRMLDELPLDAFRPIGRLQRRPWPLRFGAALLATVRGRRVILANVDPLVGFLYRAGAKLFFTRPVVLLCGLLALAGMALFGWNWTRGDQSTFLFHDSYAWGALILLGLNVVALACHELGHALAARHAGRRVPAAGFLVYFGIPSVFVDTTDVWMAGRRARLRTTAAGPATGLVLAGLAQVVGFAFPVLAPLTFKLSFAWYLNAAFNLNPFIALDGYYLLMDWLELPNLRARGMAWVIARLRRRPPRFGALDREGRLVALYGMLAVVWLVIAGNIAYRVYIDRVHGLVTGLWRAGWPARVLLAAVIVGLASPLVYLLFGWLGRRARRLRTVVAERRAAADAPRRLRAVQASALGSLPAAGIAEMVDRSRWIHPRTGEQLVFAGAAQPDVYVVVEGALEARRPGDPAGTVRERVGPGGLVGLAGALTGAPSALAWHTAGTTLLAVPSATVAAAVGPFTGPPPAERAELEALLAETAALRTLSDDDRLGVVAGARPTLLGPGDALVLDSATDAAIVSSGAVMLHDGSEVRRGALLVPGLAGNIGAARTPARVWVLPAVAGQALLVDKPPATNGPGGGAAAPGFGAHPITAYPPLAAPPGPPPPTDDEVDRRFERKLWWLLLLLLLLALLVTGANLVPGPAWAEMPTDRALLRVEHGRATATVAGVPVTLRPGDQVYVRRSDAVRVASRSTARLTFRGGADTVLCGGSRVGVGDLYSDAGQPIQPTGAVTLIRGRLLADTVSPSGAFRPLHLAVTSAGSVTTSEGAARFLVDGADVAAVAGPVSRDGAPVPVTHADFSCGDGTPGAASPAVPGTSEPGTPSLASTPSVSPSPSVPPSVSPSASVSPTLVRPTTGPAVPPTTRPAGPPPTTGPPPDKPPVITNPHTLEAVVAQRLNGAPCSVSGVQQEAQGVYADITDPDDPQTSLTVTFSWVLDIDPTAHGGGPMNLGDGIWANPSGSMIVDYAASHAKGGTTTIVITAKDPKGKSSSATITARVDACQPPIP